MKGYVKLEDSGDGESAWRWRRVWFVRCSILGAGVVVTVWEIALGGLSQLFVSSELEARRAGKEYSWLENLASWPSTQHRFWRQLLIKQGSGQQPGFQRSFGPDRHHVQQGWQNRPTQGNRRNAQQYRSQAAEGPHGRQQDWGQTVRPPVSSEESQAWDLMTVANGALGRRKFLSALGFAAVAATLVVNTDKALATEATDGPAQQPRQGLEEAKPSSFSLKTSEASTPGVSSADPRVDLRAIIAQSAKEAFAGGEAGTLGGLFQALALTWLYTANYYQYANGGTLGSALKALFDEGGIARLYQGLPFTLIEGPLVRLGDTAANVGTLAFLNNDPDTAALPTEVKTAVAAVIASLWIILCQPVDTGRTVSMAEGQAGLEKLKQKVLEKGPSPLFQGSLASAAESLAKDYPFFLTYAYLDGILPDVSKDELPFFLLRSALLGVSATCVSETVTNSFRVIKTTQQMAGLEAQPSEAGSKGKLSIAEALAVVLQTDGVKGLFGRGLDARLLASVIQGAVFGDLLKEFQTSGS